MQLSIIDRGTTPAAPRALPAKLPVPAELVAVRQLPRHALGDLFVDVAEDRGFPQYGPAAPATYSDGASTVSRSLGGFMETVAAARELAATKRFPHTPGSGFAHAVYQAKDGPYYVALLGNLEATDSDELVTLRLDGTERFDRYDDGLRAVVDTQRWVRFD